jgi:hypothetical protein
LGSDVPCSRLQSIRAFPEGLEGLGAGVSEVMERDFNVAL